MFNRFIQKLWSQKLVDRLNATKARFVAFLRKKKHFLALYGTLTTLSVGNVKHFDSYEILKQTNLKYWNVVS